MSATAPAAAGAPANLAEHFPEGVAADTRKGYEGYVVGAGQLLQVAGAIRDKLGYDYLSSVTGVDYPDSNQIEVVYHAFKTSGGPGLNFKVQADRNDPVVPSLVGLYPGAEFQEREIFDMYGVRFDGHPDLRRILMWDGFAGHPMRKDWKEPFFEEDLKPFGSRWPGGDVRRSEELDPFGANVQYPPDFDPYEWTPETENAIYKLMQPKADNGNGGHLKTDKLVVNIGPQHPSTHGVFRMVVVLDGETVVDLKPVMGYLHRNHEKIGERNTFLQNMPYTDRLDYLASMSNNHAYALSVERLMGVKVPERAEYLRVLMVELTRICSHMWAIGFLLNDLGAFQTPALYAIKERELILDLFEATAGSRMMCNYMRFGGVSRDLPAALRDENTMDFLRELVVNRLPYAIDELDRFLTHSEILRARCIGVGVLAGEKAIAYSAAGPLLRASGVNYDLRRADPYSIYDRFDFNVCTRPNGD
ncbi:MAG: NADH-quinone oxidoreductase subunit NuoD, partial [Chloroflexi bacterium]